MGTSILIRLRSCSTNPTILLKNGAHIKPFGKSVENIDAFTKKPPRWKLLFTKVAGLEFIPAIWFKKGSTTKISERYFCQIIFNKVRDLQSAGCNFIKNNAFLKKKKKKERTLNSKGGFYYVKGNIYIWMWMPMLMPMQMPTCWCRDFQTAIDFDFVNDS